MCRATQSLRRAARRPGKTIEMKVIKAETKAKVAKMESAEIRSVADTVYVSAVA